MSTNVGTHAYRDLPSHVCGVLSHSPSDLTGNSFIDAYVMNRLHRSTLKYNGSCMPVIHLVHAIRIVTYVNRILHNATSQRQPSF